MFDVILYVVIERNHRVARLTRVRTRRDAAFADPDSIRVEGDDEMGCVVLDRFAEVSARVSSLRRASPSPAQCTALTTSLRALMGDQIHRL